MAGQSVTKIVNQNIQLNGLFTKDANGNPCQGITYKLDVVSGDPTGLQFQPAFSNLPAMIACVKPGVYTVTLTATNSGGSITSDAAGDTNGTVDTITVEVPAPASQGWTYV